MSGCGLVLACDLALDGNQLGPKTIKRLTRGLEHHRETGDTLVVAASFSPDFPEQRRSMAVMMAAWLNEHGCSNVVVLNAKAFNTRGELDAFFELKVDGERTIISAPYHLRRTRLIVWQMFGWQQLRSTRFVAVDDDTLSMKETILEPLKLVHVLLPPSWRDPAVALVRKLGINPSW